MKLLISVCDNAADMFEFILLIDYDMTDNHGSGKTDQKWRTT